MPIIGGGAGGSGGGGSVSRVFDSTLGAPAANFDINPIAGTFSHLLLVATLRTDKAASAVDEALMRINGDSGANYSDQDIEGSAAAAAAVAHGAVNFARLGWATGSTATANFFGSIVAYFPDYANTARAKTCEWESTIYQALAAGNLNARKGGSIWSSTAAITQITITSLATANFIAGSRVTLYGLS